MTKLINFSLRNALLILCMTLFSLPVLAQDEAGGWPGLPPVGGQGITLRDQTSFLVLMGAAATSYGLAEFVFKNENLNYYQGRLGHIRGTGNTSVIIENFGIEKRVAPWFAIAVELNNQQWFGEESNGMGMGLNTYYRWYAFGKKRLSPYLEYGAGTFVGFTEFPADGSNFTFNLSTAVGLEYTSKNMNKLRVQYGHLHQSNNDLFPSNPGFEGNGVSMSYAWYWGKSRW